MFLGLNRVGIISLKVSEMFIVSIILNKGWINGSRIEEKSQNGVKE